MNKLIHFTKNPFLTIDIAKERLCGFISDHCARMRSGHNPVFVPLIAVTTGLNDQIFAKLVFIDENKNLSRSLTRQVNNKMKEFKTKVLQMESFVIVKFEKNSTEYNEFYPKGRTQYYRVNKTNVLSMFNHIITATTKYESDLGSEWKDWFTQAFDVFEPLYGQQTGIKGAVKQAVTEFKILKKEVCLQMYKNLLVILAEYHKNPKRAMSFFDEKIVNWKKHKKKVVKVKEVPKVLEVPKVEGEEGIGEDVSKTDGVKGTE